MAGRTNAVYHQRQMSARSKYGNRKVTVFGITFDSKKEAERYLELRSMEKRGEISGLELQKEFLLIPTQLNGKWRACKYIADFVYLDKDGKRVVEDAKGFRTEVYKIKRKLMLYQHGIVVREV